jgi:hypothetical protein
MIIFMEKAFLFDFTDAEGNNMIQGWADSLPLQKRTRAKLESKIDMLAKAGDDLPPGLLQPTRCKHIMEIATKGNVAVRLMLCRGPFDMSQEFTFLYGSRERDKKYVPRDAPERADSNRNDLQANPRRRRKHETFIKSPQRSIQR